MGVSEIWGPVPNHPCDSYLLDSHVVRNTPPLALREGHLLVTRELRLGLVILLPVQQERLVLADIRHGPLYIYSISLHDLIPLHINHCNRSVRLSTFVND